MDSTRIIAEKTNLTFSEFLTSGKKIQVYALPDDPRDGMAIFDLNLAAGLKESIISILKPKWNGSGRGLLANHSGG